jgi:hypothetical protein
MFGLMPALKLICNVCQREHQVEVDDPKPGKPIIFVCPDVDRRYRLGGFFVDGRRGLLGTKQYGDEEVARLQAELGVQNFDLKLKRWKGIAYPPIGLIDEYPQKITEIINAYSMGYMYPAVTSCCCLAERILNRLVLQCRKHFKSHQEYKKVFRKKSFDDWDYMLKLIKEWKLIPSGAIELFDELRPIRHQSIHYNEGYDFEAIAESAVNKLISAITEVFGVMNRKDIYLVFDVPGEVWVRSEAESLPFVKEFVIPHCYRAHAVHDVDYANGKIVERLGKVGPLTDNEFVELRKAHRA